jgi:hypothetical protein
MQCVATLIQESPRLPGRIPCHLLHPRLVWVPRNPGQADAAALQMHEEQYVVRHQATPSEDLHRQKIDPSQHGQMRWNEFLPRGGLAPFLRCRRYAMPLQDFALLEVNVPAPDVPSGPNGEKAHRSETCVPHACKKVQRIT